MLTNLGITSKIETYRMSEFVALHLHIDTTRPQDAVDEAFIKTPELQDINGLFAQNDFEHQHLRKTNDPETSICEHVIGVLGTPLPGVELWKTKFRIDYGEHRKTATETNNQICRAIAGLFDKK